MKAEKQENSLFGTLPVAEIGTRFLDSLAARLLENEPKKGKSQSPIQKIAALWTALEAEQKRSTLNRIAEVALAAAPMIGLAAAVSDGKKKTKKKPAKAKEEPQEVAVSEKRAKKKAKKK